MLESLTQKVEFLEAQLEDNRRRETQLRAMYDAMLSSLSAPDTQPAPTEAQLPASCTHVEELRELRTTLREAQESARDKEFSLRDQKLIYEQSLLEANKHILRVESEKSHLLWKVKQSPSRRRKGSKALRGAVRKLRADLNSVRGACSTEVAALQQHAVQSINCMKDVYEEQCKRLRTQVSELQQTLRDLQSDSLFLESNLHSAEQLREQLHEKTAEVEHLQRTLWQKSSDQRSLSCKDCYSLLQTKTRQVEDLKRQAGELRIQLNSPTSMKPPSPLHSRTASQSPLHEFLQAEAPTPFSPPELTELKQLATFRRMFSSCAKMQCAHCSEQLPPAGFHDHILVCRLEALQGKPQPEADRSRLKALKLKVGQLRNDRDRARLEAEKLLVQLKSVKLDWALTEERQAERMMQLRVSLKQVLHALSDLRHSSPQLDGALSLLRNMLDN